MSGFFVAVQRLVRRIGDWAHDALGWHDGRINYGGNDHLCSRCKQRVLQDSQCGWFLASNNTGERPETRNALMQVGYPKRIADRRGNVDEQPEIEPNTKKGERK